MNLFRRALTAVTRRKGKTVILSSLFLAIAILITSGFSILNATKAAGKLARQKLGATLTLSYDMSKIKDQMRQAREQGTFDKSTLQNIKSEPVTLDMANKIKALPHVSGMNIVVNTAAMASGFEPVESTSTTSSSTQNNNQPKFNQDSNFTMPDLTVVGVSSISAASAFQDGSATILQQQALPSGSKAKGVYIETTLATADNLKLGSTIKITPVGSTTVTELSVVGIYESKTTGEGGFRMNFGEPSNTIYVDYDVALTIKSAAAAASASSSTSSNGGGRMMGFNSTDGIDKITFQVDDPENINTVLSEAKKVNIDWTKYVLDANDAAYQAMMKPIDNVGNFAKIAVIIVSIAGALILALILALWVKERIYETGVLLSMGEGKLKIIGQYACEVLLIAAIAFTVSIPIGGVVSKSLANVLITNETTAVQSQNENQMGNPFMQQGSGRTQFLGRNAQTTTATLTASDVDVNVTPKVIAELYGLGLLIILLATVVPASSVMRMNPKTILTKAN